MRPAAGHRGGVALAGILLAGAALHLPFLGAASLWMDEALTLLPALRADGVRPLVALVRSLDTQPPLSHLAIYVLRDLLPAGELGLRLPNFLALQAGLVFLFLLIRRTWGAPTALVAVAIAEVSPYLAFYGAEARNYGLWFAAVCASWWLLLRWAGPAAGANAAAPGALAVAAWGMANGVGLLVHLFQVFALATQWAAIGAVAVAIPRGPRRRLLAAGVAGTLLAFAVFAPWGATIAARAGDGAAGVDWTRPPSLKTLAALPYALALGFSWGPGLREAHALDVSGMLRLHGAALAAAAAVLALVVAAAARLLIGRGGASAPAAGVTPAAGAAPAAGAPPAAATAADRIAFLLVPAAGVAGPVAYALATHFPLHPRHLMFLAPIVPLLLARLVLSRGPGRLAAAALVALQIGALVNLRADPAYAKDDERGAVRFAEERSAGEACIVGDVAPLYVTRSTGLVEQFADLRDPRLCADVADLWWVENRPWEDPDGRVRRKMERAARERGLEPLGTEGDFRGVTLHHWRRSAAPEGAP